MTTSAKPHGGAIVVAGLVPGGPSGMRDYGDLLAGELRRRELNAEELWFQNDGVRFGLSMAVSLKLLRQAWSIPRNSIVLWQYSPFAYGVRGVSLPGTLFGMLLRARAISVVTVLHELAYPWGRRGLIGRGVSLTQNAALLAVLAGSTAVVVTTDQRARSLHKRSRLAVRAPVHVVPVFSNITSGVPRPAGIDDSSLCLGIIGYGSDGFQAELFIAALRHLTSLPGLRVVLLGAPGPLSDEWRQWAGLARSAGMDDVIEFTGIVSATDLSAEMGKCSVIALLDEEGPSSRRTMLAASLAHGRPTVSTDGPNRWAEAIVKGAITVVPPDADELGRTLRRLLEDPEERALMGTRAHEYYLREMSLEKAGESFATLIATIRDSAS